MEMRMRAMTRIEIEEWIVDYVASTLGIEPDEVGRDTPFSSLGLDSTAAVGMTGDLEDWLQVEIDPAACYDHPTISAIAGHVANACSATNS
jgi:acyl carrier protein